MKSTKRIRRGIKGLFLSAGVVFALLVIVWVILDVASGIKLRRAVAGWQEAGYPMRLSALAPQRIPPEENAAVILNHVVDFVYLQGGKTLLIDRSIRTQETRLFELADEINSMFAAEEFDSETVGALEDALSDPLMVFRREIARKAVAFDRFDAYHDYEEGLELLIPHVAEIRNLARLMRSEATWHAVQNRWTEAFEAIEVSMRLGDLIKQELFAISQLTGVVIHRESFRQIETLSRHPDFDIEDFSATVLLPEEAALRDLIRLLRNDVSGVCIDFYRRWEKREDYVPNNIGISSNNPWLNRDLPGLNSVLFRPLRKADLTTLFDSSQRLVAELVDALGQDDWVRIGYEREERLRAEIPWYAFVTDEISLSYINLLVTWHVHLAELRLGKVALAVHRYRKERGEWPGTLDELVPDFLPEAYEDPFSRSSFRYVRENDRVVLYSVGPNQNDDGGLAIDRPSHDQPGDIVWVLE